MSIQNQVKAGRWQLWIPASHPVAWKFLLFLAAIRQNAGLRVALMLLTPWWVLCSINVISPFGPSVARIARLTSGHCRPMSTALVECPNCYRTISSNRTVAVLTAAQGQGVGWKLALWSWTISRRTIALPPACHWSTTTPPPNVLEWPMTDVKKMVQSPFNLNFSCKPTWPPRVCKNATATSQ